jgi:carboxymethylenebutenolidase
MAPLLPARAPGGKRAMGFHTANCEGFMSASPLSAQLSTGIGALHAPTSQRRAGLVLAQEIFGVNANIAALAHQFAGEGFEVLAPDYFGRIEPGFQADYDEAGTARGRAAVAATPWDQVAADTQAAIDWLAARGPQPVVAMGFCWGGAVAWLAAQRCTGLAASVGFYGRLIVTLLEGTPRCPVQLHYGAHDPIIPPADIDAVRAAFPDVPVQVWPAGHGFFSDRGHDHDPAVAAQAWQMARAFLLAPSTD